MVSVREVNINLTQIEDQVASWLYAMKAVNENQEITNIQFGAPELNSKGDYIVPLKVEVRGEGGDKTKK